MDALLFGCVHASFLQLIPTLIVATVTTRTEKKKKQPTHVLVDSNPALNVLTGSRSE